MQMAHSRAPENKGMPHHCGHCGCCGGHIPCGVTHVRRWTYSGECPGCVNPDGMCGAMIETWRRKRERPGGCHN